MWLSRGRCSVNNKNTDCKRHEIPIGLGPDLFARTTLYYISVAMPVPFGAPPCDVEALAKIAQRQLAEMLKRYRRGTLIFAGDRGPLHEARPEDAAKSDVVAIE